MDSWVKPNRIKGKGNAVVNITATENAGARRSSIITVSVLEGLSSTINLEQSGKLIEVWYATNIIRSNAYGTDIHLITPSGEEYDRQFVEYGMDAEGVTIVAEEKEGYKFVFDGWYDVIANPAVKVTSDKTIVPANITEESMFQAEGTFAPHVTFDPNGGTASFLETYIIPERITEEYIPTCTKAETETESYEFLGWFYTEGTIIGDDKLKPNYLINEPSRFIAKWNVISKEVTLSIGVNGNGSVNITSTTGIPGNFTDFITATPNTGYHFTKWTYKENGILTESTTNPEKFEFGVTSDVIANFQINTYTVTWNPNGGSVSPTQVSKTHGSTLDTLPTPTRASDAIYTYSFKGWFTSASGGTQITTSKTVLSNVTYYAQWNATRVNYTLTYNANGGSVSPTSKVIANGSAYGTLPTPTRSSTVEYSYSFKGWFTAASGDTQVNANTIMGTSNTTIYAQWTATKRKYTLTVTAGTGGTVSGGGSYNYGTSVTIRATASSGYHFVKWSDNNTSASRTVTVNGNITYTATFAQDPYLNLDKTELTFEAAGGTQTVKLTSNVSWSVS